jgi:hypothetical protein
VDARVGLDFDPNIDGRLCPQEKRKKVVVNRRVFERRTIPFKSDIKQIFRSRLCRAITSPMLPGAYNTPESSKASHGCGEIHEGESTRVERHPPRKVRVTILE